MSIQSHPISRSALPRVPLALSGHSAAAASARAAFATAVQTNAPLLIVAEAGLELDSIARAVHDAARRGQPFVTVDCAAGDAAALQDQLFGGRPRVDSRDAVDAVSAGSALVRSGRGTLFLKNVLDLPAGLQRRLSRILRDAEVRAGGRRVPVACHVIAGAPPAITSEVAEGHFRADLFRRLGRMTLTVPSLRERSEDIPELAVQAVAELAQGCVVVLAAVT